MNVHVDLAAHYKQVRYRIAHASMPARIRLAMTRYGAPIGPERAKPVKLYAAPIGPKTIPPFQRIRDEELAAAGVTLTQFMGDCRRKHLTAVRRIIWARAAKETNLSIAHIGRLSGKDHTTVLSGLRRAVELETGIRDERLEKNRMRARLYWQPRTLRSAAAAIVEG